MRSLYSLLFYCATPLIFLRLFWRSFKTPAHKRRWNERLAIYFKKYPQNVIWFHAVSLGEVEALFPLVKQFQHQYPAATLLITTITPTGSARIQSVLEDTVSHVYLPYDLPDAVARFMHTFKPKIAIIMETEIWPNLFAWCGNNAIPLYIVNARLTEKSVRSYVKFPALIRPALQQVKFIATQTDADSNRFISIGATSEHISNLGNTKFDVSVDETTIAQGLFLKQTLFKDRFVWLIASTHKDEESIFLSIYQVVKLKIPELLLVIVPRHQQRFAEVEKITEQSGLAMITRSSLANIEQQTDIYLANTIGELKMFYATADVAFVAGSMVAAGGHNILEAAIVGVPIMFGFSMDNFKDIADSVLKADAAIQCHNEQEIIDTVMALYEQPMLRESLIAKGKAFVRHNQGVITRLCKLLEFDNIA